MGERALYTPEGGDLPDYIESWRPASYTERSGLNPEITLYERAFDLGLPITLLEGKNFRSDLISEDQVKVFTDDKTRKFLLDLRQESDIDLLRDSFTGYISPSYGEASRVARKTAIKLLQMGKDERIKAGKHHPLHNAVQFVTDRVLYARLKAIYTYNPRATE